MTDGSSVRFKYVSESPGRPPLVRLFFDVTLNNAAAEPRWFALPILAKPIPRPADAGVNGVSPFRLTGARGSAVLVSFLGTGAVQAVLVPAHGTVRIRHLTLQLWQRDRPQDPLSLEVVVARDLRVGDQPVRSWLSVDPMSDANADVERTERLRAYDVPDARELPLGFVDPETITASVRLPRRGVIEPGP